MTSEFEQRENDEEFVPIKNLPEPTVEQILTEEPVAYVTSRSSMGLQFSQAVGDSYDVLNWEKEKPDDIGLYRESIVVKLREELKALRKLNTVTISSDKPMTESEFLTKIQMALIMLSGTAVQKTQAAEFFRDLYNQYPSLK